MLFPEFARRLKGIIGGDSGVAVFTKSLFDAILDEETLSDKTDSVLNEYSKETFKAYFHGTTGITKIAKKITPYADATFFEEYISDFPDSTREFICEAFVDELPKADPENIGKQLAQLFMSIIVASASSKRNPPKAKTNKKAGMEFSCLSDKAPELTPDNAGQIFIIDPSFTNGLLDDEYDDASNPFADYLETAVSYYSTKKTLLYAEKPYPFYDLFVCSDIKAKRVKITGFPEVKSGKTISDVTIEKLEAETKYAIIEGIGGIGKSMLMTHLFLESARRVDETGKIPVFLTLKDYKENTSSVVDFICSGLKVYDDDISRKQIVDALQTHSLILLFDGLDEIQSAVRDSFETDLEAFIKSYPGNTIVITSRPINSFISFAKFMLFDLRPLSKSQAINLIEKLDFWDTTAKNSFIDALDKHLYISHYRFASNPLLLTIMLMTYSSFGEVPAKMHVFYSKAYETMARLHDATKGSYRRPLHTKLTPEEFAKLFSQFCARTYKDEVLEFTESTFASYMKKVLKGTSAELTGITPRDFLLDATDNLCIMYHEGDKYYFIHRSFQEYFAAVYFASDYDEKLYKVGMFFEKMQHRSYSDKTFDMLYDMIPEKVERYIFLPFLGELLAKCAEGTGSEEYWAFLEKQYPTLYEEEGDTGEVYENAPQSFLYQKMTNANNLSCYSQIEELVWPKQIENLPTTCWSEVHRNFMEYGAYTKYPDPENIPESELEYMDTVERDHIPSQYEDYFGDPDIIGKTTEIEIYELRKNPQEFAEIRAFMESKDFPLVTEFKNIKRYYKELMAKAEKGKNSDDLFED